MLSELDIIAAKLAARCGLLAGPGCLIPELNIHSLTSDYTLLHYHSKGGASFCINLFGMPFLLDNEEAGPMYEL